MPSSERARLRSGLIAAALVVAGAGVSSRASGQQQVQGFAVDRLYASAPGGGWFVLDDLDLHGGLGGAMSATTGYAHDSLRVTDGSQHQAVVSDLAVTDFAFAVTYDRWRLSLDLAAPVFAKGDCASQCTVGGYQRTSPSFDLGTHPDTLSDPRLGVDVRVFGDVRGPFRLGAGAQLYAPNGVRGDYDTDGTWRGMVRGLAAGDLGVFTYAGQLGVHVRPLDDSPAPGSPQGSELLFGIAAGARLPMSRDGATFLVVGPEIYGETAFRSFLGTSATGVESLLTGRLERTPGSVAKKGPGWRVKLGGGAGLDPHFGSAAWRTVVGIEIFDHNAL
ncbi:MAG TPA: hypothetical protein VGL81_12235 [Polyangiaceae bacterium]|jgi:hypothetical protein